MGNIEQHLAKADSLNNLSQSYILHKRINEYNKQFENQGYVKPNVTLYYYTGLNKFSYLEVTALYVPTTFQNGKGFIIQKNDGNLYMYLVPQQPFINVSSAIDTQNYMGYLVDFHKANQNTDLTEYTWTYKPSGIPMIYMVYADDDKGTNMTTITPDTNPDVLTTKYLGYCVSKDRPTDANQYTWVSMPQQLPTLDVKWADNTSSMVINLTQETVLDDLQNNSIDIIRSLDYS